MLMVTSKATRDGLKGRPPPRACPADFDVIFVEQGRVGCEAWYRARRSTIDRWLDERGKAKLIKDRAEFVAHQRANGNWMTRSTRLVETRPTARSPRLQAIRDRRKVNPTIARHAAQFLRIMRHGGYIISPAQNGDWWVGSRRLSAAQMLDLARGKGFDDKVVLILPAETEPADRIVHHPERLATCKPTVLAQRSDGTTYIPNAAKKRSLQRKRKDEVED